MRYCCAMPTLKHCLQFDNDQPPARRAALRILAALALFVLIAAPPVRAEPPREHQIKAAFVYNFLQFIRWPDGAFKDDKAPIVIGVIDNDAFFDAVTAAVREKTVNGREITVRRFMAPADVADCHVLFVGAVADNVRVTELLRRTAGKGVLTVGEADGFTAAGGVVRFFTENNKMRFEVNVKAAGRQRLELSAKLLKLARIYEE